MFGTIVIARTVRKYGKAKRNVIAALLYSNFRPGNCAPKRVHKRNVSGCAGGGKRKKVMGRIRKAARFHYVVEERGLAGSGYTKERDGKDGVRGETRCSESASG